MRTYAIGLGVAALTFYLGMQYQRWSRPDLSAESRRQKDTVAGADCVQPTPSPSMMIAPGSGITKEELREELQNALQTARAAEAEPAEEAEETAQADERLTPEVITLSNQASAVIDTAIARGTWSAEDRNEFRRLADEVTDTETQFELFRRLAEAANNGTVKLDLDGPAF